MKHAGMCIVFAFMVLAGYGQSPEKMEYSIGDRGPSGGYVFYVNPSPEQDGWKYLEAAPEDQSGGIEWGDNYMIHNPADIGSGFENTNKIIAIQGEGLISGKGPYAAKICGDFTLGSFADWYLPSKMELKVMYENLKAKKLGNFTDGFYWSSTGSEAAAMANARNFADGGSDDQYGFKNFKNCVRAVRRF